MTKSKSGKKGGSNCTELSRPGWGLWTVKADSGSFEELEAR